MNQQLDTAKLAAAVRTKRGEAGLRETAKAIGQVSSATLSRIEQSKLPDVETFFTLCRWLGVQPSEFSTVQPEEFSSGKKQTTPEMIEAHLRADRTLSPETANTLVNMIKLAYRKEPRK